MSIIQSLAKLKQSRSLLLCRQIRNRHIQKQNLVNWTMNYLEKQQIELTKGSREGNTLYILTAKDSLLESMHQKTLLPALYEDLKVNFPTSAKALYALCEKKYKDELSNTAKQKRDPSMTLQAGRRG